MIMIFRLIFLLTMICGLVQSLGFYLDPIKQREIKNPKDLEKAYTCFRYELENEITIIEILNGGEITNQKLNLLVKDQNGNILRKKDVNLNTKMVLKPDSNSIVDICSINIVSDASWSNKGIAREMSLTVDVLNSNPKINFKEKKDLDQKLSNINQIMVEDVERSLIKFEKDMKHLIKREHQLRDLNELIFAKTLYVVLAGTIIFAISQLVIFLNLRRFANLFW
ncbi:Transmembrane protein [Wickerhamomyces ciferrii]|uniref:Transmembrane protein n=1 Tax=Wickerhamomyces ciferrii (strain ATCC 14091 / BCRC 22168 / CBS 111 / JCM 3599 / NBRC 0793 / NRRL Y-1031 F-60-10) TaxID=1206466 RepID=K0K8X8_WICCF|nr:Transmembrane protein [Wickerhamomyces ciferrii]CCH41295.1 Transmembrane protein [Wickerhamomyces ciferrii]